LQQAIFDLVMNDKKPAAFLIENVVDRFRDMLRLLFGIVSGGGKFNGVLAADELALSLTAIARAIASMISSRMVILRW
jgi:hypothetical protein